MSCLYYAHTFFLSIFSAFVDCTVKKPIFLSIFTIFICFSFIFFSCFYFYFLTLFLVCSIRDSFLTDFVLLCSWIFGIFYNYFLLFLCTMYSDYVEYIYLAGWLFCFWKWRVDLDLRYHHSALGPLDKKRTQTESFKLQGMTESNCR